jgi:hypothetical protein
LANHLTAIATKKGDSFLLLRASQFYQFAHKMQNALQSTTSSLCLGIIIMNNLGHLQRACGNFQQAECYFFTLASQLRRMASAEGREEEDFHGADGMQLLSQSAFLHFSIINEICAAAE